jgi:hypothetical protein
VRGIRRRCLEGVDHDLFDHVVADAACSAGPGLVDEPVEAFLREAVPPLRDRGRVAPDAIRDLLTGQLRVRARQDDPAPQRQRLRARMPASPALELAALGCAQDDLDGRASPLRLGHCVSVRCWQCHQHERATKPKIPDLNDFSTKQADRLTG